ncbi:hypothetical protein SAMD00019534_054090 [Acytostelium subglobosum LB1]|uniref:hypothetical protein n=1 Tax=Acytostelium subglobosum LB1 TaxID=1410327 RepID=UPI000645045B|nr:hypothetical protein SAMD00019534_054090 [Acytostelium subglobosum LB1]GAM22234.1 hypothetical protein SAMD00019534_054090 [Acytostelium subglobosum LB1]|eukprot:XP_012754354.1 hypothetical protein SAMD00019534_054090 [Acytostelium subglobosum LB1]
MLDRGPRVIHTPQVVLVGNSTVNNSTFHNLYDGGIDLACYDAAETNKTYHPTVYLSNLNPNQTTQPVIENVGCHIYGNNATPSSLSSSLSILLIIALINLLAVRMAL